MIEKEGLVIKSYCGYFQVNCEGKEYRCQARGKIGSGSIFVGDYVIITPQDDTTAIIERISRRDFHFKKPPVSNISQVVLVFSIGEPALDLWVLDNFILLAEISGLPPVLCINKIDLHDESTKKLKDAIKAYSDIGYKVIMTSTVSGEGVDELKDALVDNISVFVGLSGVGKSSLMNKLKADLGLKVSDVSAKIKRGKHTTRFVELIEIAPKAWVVDTPGFSFVKHDLDPKELAEHFPEIRHYIDECKFADCLHLHEPGCKVKEAVEAGKIAQFRYDNYMNILNDLMEKERNKYR